MEMLTAQKIFEKSAKRLLKQNRRTAVVDPADGKKYYPFVAPNGDRCGCGHLLSKAAKNSNHCDNGEYHAMGVDREKHHRLLQELVYCHDRNKPSRWPRVLRRIARDYNLKIPAWLQCKQ